MKFKFLIPIVFFITLSLGVFSQPDKRSGNQGLGRGVSTRGLRGPRGPIEPPLIPIDAGVSILLATGALLGAKKIYDANKKK